MKGDFPLFVLSLSPRIGKEEGGKSFFSRISLSFPYSRFFGLEGGLQRLRGGTGNCAFSLLRGLWKLFRCFCWFRCQILPRFSSITFISEFCNWFSLLLGPWSPCTYDRGGLSPPQPLFFLRHSSHWKVLLFFFLLLPILLPFNFFLKRRQRSSFLFTTHDESHPSTHRDFANKRGTRQKNRMSQERIFSKPPPPKKKKKDGGNIKFQKWGLTLGLFREIYPREKILISSAQFPPPLFLPTTISPLFSEPTDKGWKYYARKKGEMEEGGRPSSPDPLLPFSLGDPMGRQKPEKKKFFWSMARSDLMAISTFLPTAAV